MRRPLLRSFGSRRLCAAPRLRRRIRRVGSCRSGWRPRSLRPLRCAGSLSNCTSSGPVLFVSFGRSAFLARASTHRLHHAAYGKCVSRCRAIVQPPMEPSLMVLVPRRVRRRPPARG
eukprot:8737525-Heterocapsa_arctica.AAC.1